MIENGMYIVSSRYFDKFKIIGCKFKDCKDETRPIFCCLKDIKIEGLFWAIPVSEITQDKIKNGTIDRVKKYVNYKEGSLGWAFYHIAKTNKEAIYNISSTFPIIDTYIEREWEVSEKHFIVPYISETKIIKQKLRRILSEELKFPNKFEQRITDIKNLLIKELFQQSLTEKILKKLPEEQTGTDD